MTDTAANSKSETLEDFMKTPEAQALLEKDPELKAAVEGLTEAIKEAATSPAVQISMRADYCLVLLTPPLPNNPTQKERDDHAIRNDLASHIGSMYKASIKFAVATLIANCVNLLEESLGGRHGLIDLYAREPRVRLFIETLKKSGVACLDAYYKVDAKAPQILNLVNALEPTEQPKP